jgi:phospholipase C
MLRRDFLRSASALGAAALLGPDGRDADAAPRLRGGSMLDGSAAACPIDTIVVCMMENRSFDHYLGWLGTDEAYMEAGRSRYGRRFRVNGETQLAYADPDGALVDTFALASSPDFPNPHRGCGFRDPGHGWNAGRAQRDGGFLATGSGNDRYALGYFQADDLPFYTALTRRFTVFDRYHCSVLGPTFPNREYLHSGQSGGVKDNSLPPAVGYPGGFTWPTIWDRLTAAGVPARYYYTDLPVTFLWGGRLTGVTSTIADYLDDAASGTLPNVVFIDPRFVGDLRTDEHPHGDVRDGQRFVYTCLKAFLDSPHWQRGAFILTYDEWGGFFDHVRPPRARDDRASRIDAENFAQLGFRVPVRLISPYARPGFVDRRLYDHASILRFIEWRFLGAPAHGRGHSTDGWFLTRRDRFANNLGFSLLPSDPDPEFDPGDVSGPDPFSPPCGAGLSAGGAAPHDLEAALDSGYFESVGFRDVPAQFPF